MQTSIIVGCGYLGGRVAKRWIADGREVVGIVNSSNHAQQLELEGVRTVVADVTQPQTLVEAFRKTLGDFNYVDTVLYCVGRNPQSKISPYKLHVDGLCNLLAVLPPDTRRFIYTSSTSVYGQHHGAWVDENSSCLPTGEAGKFRLEAEHALLSHHIADRSIILRLAGLYGPERLAQRAQRLDQFNIQGGDEYLNLIHVDDAARAVLASSAVEESKLAEKLPRTFLISDGHPLTRREYFTLLDQWRDSLSEVSAEPSSPIPSKRPLQCRSAGSKRVDNTRMLRELGIFFTYPSVASFFSAQARPEK